MPASACKCNLNYSITNYRLNVIELQITNYFVKPFNYKLLSNVIKYVIELHVINYYPTLGLHPCHELTRKKINNYNRSIKNNVQTTRMMLSITVTK